MAILQFNNRAMAFLKVLEEMGCSHGHFTFEQFSRKDQDQLRKSKKKETKEEKKRRKKGLEDQQV